MNRSKKKLAFLSLASLLLSVFALKTAAQTTAPGGPGKDAQWATAGKQAIGSSATLESKVWFTLAQGVMTEVYYPDVTVANVHLLQFVVVDPKTKKVETEQDDAIHEIKVLRPDSLTFQQVNTAKSRKWKITKTYVTDPNSDSVLIDVTFSPRSPGLKLYVVYDPSLGNSGMGDIGRSIKADEKQMFGLEATDDKEKIRSLLSFSVPVSAVRNDYLKTDGLSQIALPENDANSQVSEPGNIIQTARIDRPEHFTTVLSFGNLGSMSKVAFPKSSVGFAAVQSKFEKGWADYVKTLPKVDPKFQPQFNMAAMQLKALEDKTKRGANIASLTVPWGGGENANENTVGGYHLVWARDLYQVFTAYMALGDKAAAERALDFLLIVQQKPDGSFPQNSWLDGKPYWGSLQMDEVAFPLIMAWQLGRFDKATYENHLKKAADFIVKNGPATPQERWEEESGYSPSTIAAEIAGLVCAADIAKRNGDAASATVWLAAADDWARNVERWTATTTGEYGDGNYYLRITANGDPDSGEKLEVNNGGGTFDARDIVDAGFLELVRLGIKPANDPLIAKSLKIIDQVIKVKTPNGEGFYRYNHDGYGEMDDGRRWNWDGKYTGKGRLWALLSGERGQYEVADCESRTADLSVPTAAAGGASCAERAKKRLADMAAFANEGLMIPEQIWDKPDLKSPDKQFVPDLKSGEGTGSATPLAWSMAQFIRLAVNIKAGRNLDTPQVVYDRYKTGIPGQVSNFGGNDSEVILPVKPGETMNYPRDAPAGAKAAYMIGDKMYMGETDAKGQLAIKFEVPADGTVAYGGIVSPDGATSFERVTLRQRPVAPEFSAALIDRLKTATANPVIDADGRAVLFYRGAAKMVTVAGDINGWNPNREFMMPVALDLWAIKLSLASTARSEYKLVINGKWVLDPANSKTLGNGLGDSNNVLEMPAYKPAVATPGQPKLDEFDLTSAKYGKRKIKVYLPNGYTGGKSRYGTFYFHDGTDYIDRAGAPQVMERLVAEGKIKPLILVFLDPVDRTKEYWASDDYADYVANEVVPEIDRRYRTQANRDGRATIGASLGGVTALWIGLRHPSTFSRLGGESSSFWIDNGRVATRLAGLDSAMTRFRFYLDDGTLEGVDDTRRVNVMLRGKGYDVKYVEGETGHNWTAWRDRLADAFIALWK